MIDAAPVTTCPRCGGTRVHVHGDGWACDHSDCGQTWTRIEAGTVPSGQPKARAR